MARDRGQLDLRRDIRAALEPYVHEDVPENATAAVLAAVLPHFELAYKRGQEAERSRAGYRAARKPEET
jgi:hypothetical protein